MTSLQTGRGDNWPDPVMATTMRDREFAALMVQFRMLSYGTVQQWNTSRATGKPGSRVLSLRLLDAEPHRPDHWQHQYDRARTDIERDTVITQARQELEQWTRRPKGIKYREPTWNVLRDEIAKEGKGDSPEVVALAKRTTPTLVRKARRELSLTEDRGYPAEHACTTQAMVTLRDAGKTQAEIARLLGCSQQKVSWALAKTARKAA